MKMLYPIPLSQVTKEGSSKQMNKDVEERDKWFEKLNLDGQIRKQVLHVDTQKKCAKGKQELKIS